MSKKENFRHFLKYLFFMITAVQIVFAVIWLFYNIGEYREEYLSGNYILAASSLVVDDYMGILYALIVRFLGHGILLYVFQIVVVFLATLLLPIDDRLLHLALAVNIVTNPFILQSECTVRPEALLMAAMIALVAFLIRGENIGAVISCLLMTLLNPDYLIVLAFVLIPILIFRFIKKQKYTINLVVGIIVAAILGLIINNSATDVYAYGNVEKSFNFLCMQRFAGREVSISSDIIETCYNIDLSYEMRQAEKVPEKLGLEFASKFEAHAGKENAEAIYAVIYKNALAKGPRHYLPDMIKDYFLYLFTPISTGYVWVNNVTGTLIFNPIRLFVREAYSLFEIYLLFGAVSAFVLLFASLYLLVRKLLNKSGNTYVKPVCIVLLIGFVLPAYGVFGCLRGFDYRNTLFNVAMWPILYVFLHSKKEDL